MRVDVFYAIRDAARKSVGRSAPARCSAAPFFMARHLVLLALRVALWAIFERSREAGGLPLVFPLKALIPPFAAMMALQGLAQAIKSLAMLFMLRIDRKRAAKASG